MVIERYDQAWHTSDLRSTGDGGSSRLRSTTTSRPRQEGDAFGPGRGPVCQVPIPAPGYPTTAASLEESRAPTTPAACEAS